ncbi:hypothetical protein KR044_012825 [Drosophila immigrans]|nr:hypothetical protein KR044_012825 [Drosophila immigrans]
MYFSFIMFFRMFAIAGVIWVLEILSYLFEINITLIFDLITSGQGLLLLFVTIWKRDVIKALHEK